MSANAGKTVAEILKNKRAEIKTARLVKGAPSWDDILHLVWEKIEEGARKRERGFRTLRKLLTDRRFDK